MTENRTRDYTPTSFSPDNDSHFLSNSPKDYVGSGGADDFLKVIRNEIIPFVESNFDVDKAERVLIGKSMSGLAAVHCLLTQPDLFNNYLIVSPSIWWDDWFDARSERYVMRQAKATNKELFGSDVRVYFAVGEDEERFGLVTDLYVLVNHLKNKRIDGLKINLEVLEGEIHESVFPSAFMRGIMGLYTEKKNYRPSASKIKW
jgi:predicted alpha/beta superfamily hydrolase